MLSGFPRAAHDPSAYGHRGRYGCRYDSAASGGALGVRSGVS
jgi:hypothetical protein